MSVGLLHAAWLWALPLCGLPWWWTGRRTVTYSWCGLLPEDGYSRVWDRALRALPVVALAAIVLGLAGLHREAQRIERVVTGAHIVILLDRSSSMNENFAGRYLDGARPGAKTNVASRILAEFVRRRTHDLFAVVDFGSAPVYVTPLTQDRVAVEAAIHAADRRGRGVTNIAPALSLALEHFRGQPRSGARVILLVSDGAARMEPEQREWLRRRFVDDQVTLYWLYLRTPRAASLSQEHGAADETTTPELFLHHYFQSLGVTYRAYEAENPAALERAIADVGEVSNRPLHYMEVLPRRDLAAWCYAMAAVCAALWIAASALEARTWRRI